MTWTDNKEYQYQYFAFVNGDVLVSAYAPDEINPYFTKDCKWKFDVENLVVYNEETKEVVISGNGAMYDYEGGELPFAESDIKSVVICDGVTKIGDYAVVLTRPGDSVTYTFYARNTGKYDAYLKETNNYISTTKECTPSKDATPEQKAVKEVNDKVILLMFCGGAVAFGEAKDLSNAILNCWYPGEMGGKAIAQLLFGEYSPSGKLPVTIYSSTKDLPNFDDYSMNNRTYRYFTGTPEFPFGFGLSYTKFKYDEMQIEKLDEDVKVSVTVKNIGDFDGREVVKLFKSEKDAINQPIKSLARFKKITLKKGEEKTVEFILTADDFTHINGNGEKEYLSSDKFSIFIEE